MSYAIESQVESSRPLFVDCPSLHVHAMSQIPIEQCFTVAVEYGALRLVLEPGVAREQTYTWSAVEVDALIAALTEKRALMVVAK